MFNLLFAIALVTAPQAKSATNTICPVLGSKVDAKSQIVTVRGQEYRICCGSCEKKLTTNPDTYLGKDGTPKNAAKTMNHESHAH